MPSVTLSSLAGGGGGFIPDFISTPLNINSGLSGDLVSYTPPPGKRAALIFLVVSGTGASQTGVSVRFGANTIATGNVNNQDGIIGVGILKVGLGIKGSSSSGGAGLVDAIISKEADLPLVIHKADPTTATILYAYAYGD